MHILILGNSSDAHAAHLRNALTHAGATVDYRVSFGPQTIEFSPDPFSSNYTAVYSWH